MLNIGSLNRMFRSFKQIGIFRRHRKSPWNPLFHQARSVLIVTLLCCLFLCHTLTKTAYAAETESLLAPGMQGEVAPALAEGTEIAAEKIDQFAQAYLQVLEVLSDREAEIPAAETNAEALKIEKSIESDVVALIQESGLTLPEYMQILGLASQDPTFQDKVLGRMDDT